MTLGNEMKKQFLIILILIAVSSCGKKEEEKRPDYEDMSKQMIAHCMETTDKPYGNPASYCFHHFCPFKCKWFDYPETCKPQGGVISGVITSFASKRAKVVKAIAGGIPVRLVGCFHAVCNHLFRHILVIRSFFFFSFTIHANRLMIINRQESAILEVERPITMPAI